MRPYPVFMSIALATTCAATSTLMSTPLASTTDTTTTTSDGTAFTRVLAANDEPSNKPSLRNGHAFDELDDAEASDEARMVSGNFMAPLEHAVTEPHLDMRNLHLDRVMSGKAGGPAMLNELPLDAKVAQWEASGGTKEEILNAVLEYDPKSTQHVPASKKYHDLMLTSHEMTPLPNHQLAHTLQSKLPDVDSNAIVNPKQTVNALLEPVIDNFDRTSAVHTKLVAEFSNIKYANDLSTETLKQLKLHQEMVNQYKKAGIRGNKKTADGMHRGDGTVEGTVPLSHVGRDAEATNVFKGRVLGSVLPLTADKNGRLFVGMISASDDGKIIPLVAKGGLLKQEPNVGGSLREVMEESGRDVMSLREFQPLIYKGKDGIYEMRSSVGIATAERKDYSENMRDRYWIPYNDFLMIAKNSKQPLYGMAERLIHYKTNVVNGKTRLYDEEVSNIPLPV